MTYPKKTITRYILFQVPEIFLTVLVLLVIRYYYDYPLWILWAVITLSVAKEVILFFKTWPAYVVHNSKNYTEVKGQKGIAVSDFNEKGYITINGELWKVEVTEPVKKGETLYIREMNGLVLKASKEN